MKKRVTVKAHVTKKGKKVPTHSRVVEMSNRKEHERRVATYEKNNELAHKLSTEYNKVSEEHSSLIEKANKEFSTQAEKHSNNPTKVEAIKKRLQVKYKSKLKELENKAKRLKAKKAKIKTNFWEIK